jgi:excisionase family DNA binding protein
MNVMTVQQAAERLGIAVETVRLYARTERLKGTKAGRDWIFDEKDVAAFGKVPRVRGWHGQKRNRKKEK